MRRKAVTVNDRMRRGYRHELTAPPGRNLDPAAATASFAALGLRQPEDLIAKALRESDCNNGANCLYLPGQIFGYAKGLPAKRHPSAFLNLDVQ